MQVAAPQRSLDGLQRILASPRVPRLAAAVLALACGWQLASLAWRLAPEPGTAARVTEPTAAPADAGAESGGGQQAVARIAELHLFGTAPAGGDTDDRSEPREPATDAPETQLNLTLKGVYSPGSGNGLAIIQAGSGKERVYSVGDTIAGNAEIRAIYGDRVLLDRGGRAETLRMKLADDAPARTQRRSASRPSQRERQIAKRARDLREKLLENPVQLARMVRFQPYVRNGQLVGYRIQPRGADAEQLRELGLRPSDVVTRVNGMSLDNPSQANQALQSLRDAQTIDVTFLRNGRQQRLSIPIGGQG